MAKLLTPLNLGALALSHRIIVLRGSTMRRQGVVAPGLQAASGGLLIQELPSSPMPPGSTCEAWLSDAKTSRRMIARLHTRRVLCVARVACPGAANASWARDAGFDGLELDAAEMGPAQLDELEAAVQAALESWAPDRVGIRLSPFAWLATRQDASTATAWGHLLCALAGMELAYIHVTGVFTSDRGNFATSPLGQHLRSAFGGLLIASGAYTPEAAVTVVEGRWADAVGFELMIGRGDDLVASVTASVPASSAGQAGAGVDGG